LSPISGTNYYARISAVASFSRHHTTTTNQTMAKMAAAILLHIAIISLLSTTPLQIHQHNFVDDIFHLI